MYNPGRMYLEITLNIDIIIKQHKKLTCPPLNSVKWYSLMFFNAASFTPHLARVTGLAPIDSIWTVTGVASEWAGVNLLEKNLIDEYLTILLHPKTKVII